jgi:VIT1/CCC1 family predicted Fe2+/Mn2+ transporter
LWTFSLYPAPPIEHIDEMHGVFSMSIGSEVTGGPRRTEGMGWRIGVSIVTFFGATIAGIVWLFFYAGSFSVYQNIAVIVVILLAFIAVMGATWASWGMKQRDCWGGKGSP